MQFEIQLRTDYSTVTFYNVKVKWDVIAQMMSWFERLGGTLIETNVYQFPSFITSEVIQEVIHNTCFVCGGLMKDGQAIQNGVVKVYGENERSICYTPYVDPTNHSLIKVRKCSSCGHSHT